MKPPLFGAEPPGLGGATKEDFMRFRTIIQREGKTATGIQIPAEVVESLGAGKRPAVRMTIKGYTYRSTVADMGGGFMIWVSPDHLHKTGVGCGVMGGTGVGTST